MQILGHNSTTKAMRTGKFQPQHLGNHLSDSDNTLKLRNGTTTKDYLHAKFDLDPTIWDDMWSGHWVNTQFVTARFLFVCFLGRMRSIVTEGVAWSLPVCVFWSHSWAVQKRMNWSSLEMPFGGDSGGPKEPCIRWGSRSQHVKGQFLGVVRPIEKNCTSLLHTPQQKKSVTA